jgi:hypothetical protein
MAIRKKAAPKKNRKRTGYFKMRDEVELTNKVGLKVWAYDGDGNFVGRLEINRAGIEPFVGEKGTTSLGNLGWEKFFDRLAKKS